MSQLKGACIIGQSGGPSAVINASAYGAIKTALENEDIRDRSGTLDLTFNEDNKVHFLPFQ